MPSIVPEHKNDLFDVMSRRSARETRGRRGRASTCLLLAALLAAAAHTLDAPEHETYIYATPDGVALRALVQRPGGAPPPEGRAAVVIAHGGGWAIGEPEWGLGRGRDFVDNGMVAVSIQYRLTSPQTGVTPLEAMADTRAAIRWVRRNAHELGVDPGRVAGYGWSAGAHLLACAAIFDGDEGGVGDESAAPDALVLSSPAVAVAEDRWMRRILGERATPADISPDLHVRPGLPPTLLLQGHTDTVTPLSGTQRFHDAMLAAGNTSELVVYDGVGHLFTPSSEPDDGWPNPDREVRAASIAAAKEFLSKLGFVTTPREKVPPQKRCPQKRCQRH